ncbi:MAG: putative heme iron utilization protein [Oleiphilaceae bacterium]|jgi:putative heme iron utilization protein
MKNQELEKRIQTEIVEFVYSRKSLLLSSITQEGKPYASYAPFASGETSLYVLISEIAVHAVNLQNNPLASVLIIEDEDVASELFARQRVNYSVNSQLIDPGSQNWQQGIDILVDRHGERINNLSSLTDFKLFKLIPTEGRYVKGFGRAYAFKGESLAGELEHLRIGHKKKSAA